MKADYLRHIYECLSGDNGLLAHDKKKRSFAEEIARRKAREIAEDEDEDMGNELQKKTLLEYMAEQVLSEYDEAKKMIFNESDMKAAQHKTIEGINEHQFAPFHPVFLSSLMNQQVFKRDIMLQDVRDRMATFRKKQLQKAGEKKYDAYENIDAIEETDVAIEKDKKEKN